MSLGQYVRTVLCMEEVEFGSKIVTQQVKLKHIDCLRKLLRDFTVVDPFACVRPKYRAAIDEKSKEQLIELSSLMDLAVLVPLLKEYMIGQLGEDFQSEESSMKSIVGYLCIEESDQYLSDLPWFHQYFPDSLLMKNCMQVYQILEARQSI